MKRLLVILALLLVSGASAGMYTDARGDADASMDAWRLLWADGGVALDLGADPNHEAGYTVILFVGREGANEPDTALVMHHGPSGDSIEAISGDAPALNVTTDGFSIAYGLEPMPSGECVFAVARTVTYPVEGQQVQDVIGWKTDDIGAAWNQGRACSEGQPVDAILEGAGGVEVPGPAIIVVVASILLLRRTQR